MRNFRLTIARARFGKFLAKRAEAVCFYVEESARLLASFVIIMLFLGIFLLVLVATGVTDNF